MLLSDQLASIGMSIKLYQLRLLITDFTVVWLLPLGSTQNLKCYCFVFGVSSGVSLMSMEFIRQKIFDLRMATKSLELMNLASKSFTPNFRPICLPSRRIWARWDYVIVSLYLRVTRTKRLISLKKVFSSNCSCSKPRRLPSERALLGLCILC